MILERFAEESEKLGITTERLGKAETIEEIARALRDDGRGAIGADGIALILRDGDLCHYFEEDAIGPLWKGQKFPMGACISGWAMLKRQTVCIADIRLDKRIPYDLYENTFVRSLVMAPVEMNSSGRRLWCLLVVGACRFRATGRSRRSAGGSDRCGDPPGAPCSRRGAAPTYFRSRLKYFRSGGAWPLMAGIKYPSELW